MQYNILDKLENSMPADKILLIDAYSQIFRCFYAIRALSNSRNEPTNAIFAFTKLLIKIEQAHGTTHGALVFDCGKPAFRLEIAPDYKGNRPPMPEELRAQIPCLKELAEAFGWPLFVREGYEADDLIAGIADEFSDHEVEIISSDKDLAQLIDERVVMLIPDTKNSGFQVRGIEEVVEKFSVRPDQIIDYLALIGDSSDNIPGVQGVGPKTAAKLINECNSIEEILSCPEKITNPKLKAKITESAELLRKNIKLITLKKDIDEKPWGELDTLHRKAPDWNKIREICERMELKSILKELPASNDPADLFAAPEETDKSAPVQKEDEQKKYAPDLFDSLN
jgi:DNA polymerase-1